MAKGVGLDVGEFSVKAVEIDGSFRKPRLTKVVVDLVSHSAPSADDPIQGAAAGVETLLGVMKSNKIPKQNVCLGIPSRSVLFRQLVVPFTGVDRIRKVIKFEAEGEIHSQSVDDMVVDFHTVEEIDDETRVLVAGVPKAALRTTLDALDSANIEPEVVDLDAMALLRLAEWSGVLAAGDGLVDTSGSAGKSRVILDLGARSVRVLVITDGDLHDIRAIPLGADSIAEALADSAGCSMADARMALAEATAGQDFVIHNAADAEEASEEAEEASEDAEEAEGTELASATVVIPSDQIETAIEAFLVRLRREFMRFMVAVKGVGEIEALFVTGGGSRVGGVNDVLSEVFGCDPQPLLYMHLVQHDLSDDEAMRYEPEIAVAVGLALGRLGGLSGFNFRQEDLVYTRGFDRIKLPLAIAVMLSLFALVVYGMVLKKDLVHKESLFGYAVPKEVGRATGRSKNKATSLMQYSGFLGYLVNKPNAWPARMLKPDDYVKMVNGIAKSPTFNRIQGYKNHLRQELKRVQRDGEYDPGLELDSAVAVVQQFSGIFKGMEAQFGKFYVGEIDVSLPSKPRDPGKLKFKVFFRGSDFRARKDMLKAEFERLFEDKTSAFEGFGLPDKETTYPEADSARYDFDIQLKSSIPIIKLTDN
jgi:type IV pilus assembly protein PilM